MKHLLFAVCLLLSAFSFSSCNKDDDDTDAIVGVWSAGAQFEGPPRNGAVSFTIGNRAYVGLGWNGVDKYKDFWEYNPDNRTWRQLADFPGVARYQATAFAVNGKGYVGTGYDGTNRLNDFYEFDPAGNNGKGSWTKKQNFGGSARYGAVGLSIGSKGYIGTGYDGANKKDFWEYNPGSDSWTQKASLFGNKRIGAMSFTIGNVGYIVSGTDNGINLTDNEAYDPNTDTWTTLRTLTNNTDEDYDYSRVARNNGVSFVVNGKGYVALGNTSTTNPIDCWEYNPDADTWTQKTDFTGSPRTYGVGFGLGNTGYVATGASGTTRLDDVWQLAPDETN